MGVQAKAVLVSLIIKIITFFETSISYNVFTKYNHTLKLAHALENAA